MNERTKAPVKPLFLALHFVDLMSEGFASTEWETLASGVGRGALDGRSQQPLLVHPCYLSSHHLLTPPAVRHASLSTVRSSAAEQTHRLIVLETACRLTSPLGVWRTDPGSGGSSLLSDESEAGKAVKAPCFLTSLVPQKLTCMFASFLMPKLSCRRSLSVPACEANALVSWGMRWGMREAAPHVPPDLLNPQNGKEVTNA